MNVGLARASSSTAVCKSCVTLMSYFAGVSLLLCEKGQDVLVIRRSWVTGMLAQSSYLCQYPWQSIRIHLTGS